MGRMPDLDSLIKSLAMDDDLYAGQGALVDAWSVMREHRVLSPLLLALVFAAVWSAIKATKYIRVRRFFKNLPQPPGHTFRHGHLAAFTEAALAFPPGTHPQYFYTYLAQKYSLPGVFYIDIWPLAVPQIVITDPDTAKNVLTVNPYPKHPQIETFLRPFTGRDSIAASNGERWKSNHAMVGAGFTTSYIKPMVGMIAEQAVIFHHRLRALAVKGEPFSLEEETSRAIFDVIGKIVFGFSLDAQTAGSALLTDLRASIDPATMLLSTRNPLLRFYAWSKLRGVKRRVYDTLSAEIEERHRVMKDQKELPTRKKAKSILDRIVLDRLQSRPNDSLDREFLETAVSNLKALLLGGHGTTTDTFTFVVMFLSIHPDILKRLRDEHDTVFSPDLDVTIELLNQDPSRTNSLEYTNAVIKETLRFYPIGFTIRTAPTGVNTISHDGHKYPVGHGAMVIPNAHSTHMDPALWKAPHQFVPDRFLGQENSERNRFAWRPFERGPRACIAQDLAMDELRVMLLITARWFDFETIVEKKNVTPRVQFMDLDKTIGDLAFQVVGMEAGPRKDMRMRVRSSDR